jgi:hypothetical protein
MKLRDGTEFTLGMTLYGEQGYAIPTSAEEHELDTFELDGRQITSIGCKGSGCFTDLNHFYGSYSSYLDAEVASRRASIKQLESEIAELETLRDGHAG